MSKSALPIILSFGALYAALYAAYGAESPFLPLFLRSKGLSPEKIGFVFAMGTLVRVLTGPVYGILADKFAATGVILCACAAAAAVIALLYLVAQSYTALLAVGITHSLASTPLAPFVDTLSLAAACEEQLFEYGWVRGMGSAAFVISTLISGRLIGSMGLRSIILSSAALLGVTSVVSLSVPRPTGETGIRRTAKKKKDFLRLLQNGIFVRTMLTAMIVIGSHALNDTFAVIRWNKAGVGPGSASVLWSISVASEVVVFALIGRGLIQRFGTSGSALISIGAGVLRWSIMASSTDFLLLAGIQLLHGLTFALMHLTCMTIIDRVIPPSLAATAQTTYNNLCLGIASAFFTSLAGILYGAIGPASFWCAAALCAAGVPLATTLNMTDGGITAPSLMMDKDEPDQNDRQRNTE